MLVFSEADVIFVTLKEKDHRSALLCVVRVSKALFMSQKLMPHPARAGPSLSQVSSLYLPAWARGRAGSGHPGQMQRHFQPHSS